MEPSTYLRRLSREARWRLPPEDAKEVISDYAELLEGDARPEEALCQDMGTPRQAVLLLDERNAYRKWMAVFIGLCVCILLPWSWLFAGIRLLWGMYTWENHANLAIILMAAGAAGVLWWFSRTKREASEPKLPLPRGLRPILALQAAVLCAGFASWSVIKGSLDGIEFFIAPEMVGELVTWLFRLIGTVGALTGIWGLVRARLSDRRWRTLYVFGMVMVVICAQVLAHMHGMNLESGLAGWWSSLFRRCGILLLTGLVLSGVALC